MVLIQTPVKMQTRKPMQTPGVLGTSSLRNTRSMILMLCRRPNTSVLPRSSSDACQIVANSTLLRKPKPCFKIV